MNILLLLLLLHSPSSTLFQFSQECNLSQWRILDDGVMGGLSQGQLALDSNGNGIYSGNISLDNYGGFSSIRLRLKTIQVSINQKIKLRIKGDGKQYQFRVKDKTSQYHSYIYTFSTSGNWQTVVIPLNKMEPSFRGRRLRIPNFNHSQIEEVSILIGNKKAESFKLLIDKIECE